MADEPLEDRMWVLPPEYGPWLDGINAQWGFPPGINAENVHLVFNVSIFCDPGSANKQFEAYVNRKPELLPRYFNRRQFEQELEEYPGESYVIIAGPEKTTSPQEDVNMLWVVRRQFRTIDRNNNTNEVEVRGHYVIVADRIIAAPTLMDLLQSRWASSMLHLSNFYKNATSIPLYSIEKGYTYLLPDQKKKPKGVGDSAKTSRAGSPVADTASQTSTRPKHTSQINDDAEISRSFNLTLSYGDEFMDENPLVGEPGSFKLSSTSRTVKEKEAKEKAAEAAKEAAKSEAAESQRASIAPSPVTAAAPAPPPIKTNIERKGSGLGKGKSPTSATGDGIKKRRKSKAPITPGKVSPL